MDVQQERNAVADQDALVGGRLRREQGLTPLPETKPFQQQIDFFELPFRAGDEEIDDPAAAATGHGRAADVFCPSRRQMAGNQPGDLSGNLHGPRIEVPASDRRVAVRLDDRLNFVEHN